MNGVGSSMVANILSYSKKWGIQLSLSIADQGIASGANFLLNVLLARWLSSEKYGAFSIGFSVFLFLFGFHSALVLEPMTVFGPGRYRESLSGYLSALVWVHTGLSVLLSLVLLVTALIFRTAFPSSLLVSLVGVALALPFILLFWFFRRACYLDTRPDQALEGSFVYFLVLSLGLIIMNRLDMTTPLNAFVLMGLASVGAVLTYWRHFNLTLTSGVSILKTDGTNISWRGILLEHWEYGKWVVGSAFVYWISYSSYVPLIGGFVGLLEAGAFRAIQNLVLPLQQILTALGTLLLPWVSRQRISQGESYLRKITPKVTIGMALLASLYIVGIVLFGKQLLNLLYGAGRYDDYVWLVSYLGVVSILEAVSQGLGITLRALEKPSAVFWSQFGGAVLTASFGVLLIGLLSLYGAALGVLATALIIMTMLLIFSVHSLRTAG